MTDKDPIRVMIVDDHFMVRDGLKVFLSAYPDFVLSAEASCGEEALRLCAQYPTDVILMDLKLPEMSGIASTREIRTRHPHTQVIILTNYVGSEQVRKAFKAGAVGYLLKETPSDHLARAIRMANSGQITLDPNATTALLQNIDLLSSDEEYTLTDRESEILTLIAEGLSSKRIGEMLSISAATVNYHIGNLFTKLNVHNRMDAVRVANENGLIQTD